MEQPETGEIISLSTVAKSLRSTGGADAESLSFHDQSVVDLMLLALDFHYEDTTGENGEYLSAEDLMLEDLHKAMGEADKQNSSKTQAIRTYLEQLLEPYWDEIEEAHSSLRAVATIRVLNQVG